jgi:hypothetical protein
VAEEADCIAGGDTPAAGKDLQRHEVVFEAVHLGKGGAEYGIHLGKVAVTDIFGPDGDNDYRDGLDLAIYLFHD